MTQQQTPLALGGFARTKAQLVRTMEADGWSGRISTNGHAIMRAPDGTTTCSIRPKDTTPTERRNDEAPYRRWKAAQVQPEAIQTAIAVEDLTTDEPVPAPVDTAPATAPALPCDGCERSFATLQALSVHRVRAHVRVPCPICDQPFSPGNLDRHTATHGREFASPDLMLREIYRLRAALTEAREDATSWQVLAEDAEARVVTLQEINQRAVAALLGD